MLLDLDFYLPIMKHTICQSYILLINKTLQEKKFAFISIVLQNEMWQNLKDSLLSVNSKKNDLPSAMSNV